MKVLAAMTNVTQHGSLLHTPPAPGLHEDLNRVKQKPYVEMADSDGKADHEVGN